MITGFKADEAGGELKPFEFELGSLGHAQVDIKVEFCGICHSDLSMLNNDWGMTQFPFVPGHEVVGVIDAVGKSGKNLKVGQRVGLGWQSASCMTCEWCMSGDHNLCQNSESTIIGRYGGFAEKVRADEPCVVPLPEGVDAESAGPLFCGGITVFNPIVQFGVKPTDRVGVIGIGGLGHMALRFLDAWGCQVTAFSSSADKENEAKSFGADHFVNSRNSDALNAIANPLDYIINTVNVPLDWEAYIAALRPKGRLHIVGAVPEPIPVGVFPLLMGQKSISASPIGSPHTIAKMLQFVARHNIRPTIETYAFSDVNDAMEKLRSGKPRYRLVLKH
jgi:uncharacterized zinc-type alcohol dehydrogenase-like protein